jgi:Tol biopolymer transport system component
MRHGLRSAQVTDSRRVLATLLTLVLAAGLLPAQESRSSRGDERTAPPPVKDWVAEGEVLLKNARQQTFEGEKSGEAYFSPDQSMVSFQSVRGDCPHYQIYVKKLDGTALWRVTPGQGLTTCSHWRPDGKRMSWASTHLDPETYPPPPPEKGPYAWARHPSFDIFESDPDGKNPKRLTNTPGYDAEGSYSADGARICFTSERDGDPEIYTMAADGSDVRRVTNTPGYDGGPFFSPDGKRICFRGFRNPKNPRLANLYVIDADGKNEKQLTFDAAVNWAPYWHKDGDVLVWSKGLGGGRNFELFLIRLSDASVVRLTRSSAQDVLPVFSHDGTKLMWTSTRADGRSQLFLADFRLPTEEEWRAGTEEEKKRLAEPLPAPPESRPPPDGKRLFGDASKLADDAMQGRRAGTEGSANAADFIEATLKAANVAPAGESGTYRQTFEVSLGVEAGEFNELQIGSEKIAPPELVPMAFSRAPGSIAESSGPLVFRGYGVAAPGVHDDYAGLSDVKGKIVLLFLRGIPDGLPTDNPHADPQMFAGSFAKAKAAKDRGAAAVVFVADSRQRMPSGAEALRPEGESRDVGLPVARISRAALGKLLAAHGRTVESLEAPPKAGAATAGFDFGATASLTTSINRLRGKTDNVLGLVRGREKPDEIVILCAHYDHLGFGGPNSLAQDTGPAIHNGADDNASGTAGILEIARRLAASPPKRSVLIAAWTGEEDGLLGSAHWAERPTVDLDRAVVGVVNLDMIGRLGEDGVALDGVASAAEFPDMVKEANAPLGLKIGMTAGAMSGRSDHATFLHRGTPALHLFTGAHTDYHKPSDDADKLNTEGMVKVAALAENLVRALADREAKVAYVKPKPASQPAISAGSGAWLGTIPSYGQDSGGVKLAGVSAGSPAEAAGLQAKDVLVKLNGAVIDNIYDFTNALGACRPGQEIEVVVKRGEETVTKQIKLARR